MSELYQSLSHSRWTCKSHVVVVPKRRRQKLFEEIRRQLGPMFQELGSAGHLTLHSTVECTIQDLTFSPGTLAVRLSCDHAQGTVEVYFTGEV